MTTKTKNIVVSVVFALFLAVFSLYCWLKPADGYSIAERRELKQFPKLNFSTVLSAEFMNSFESYALDQFPLRDAFRAVKAYTALNIMGLKDVNDLYEKDGYISKMEYPMSDTSVQNAVNKLTALYNSFVKDKNCNVYTTVIPDKNYVMADKYNYLSLDYAALIKAYCEGMSFAQYIDITGLLDIEDYYKTDTHWKQEEIFDVAHAIAQQMGVKLEAEYTENTLGEIFKGVYGYQFALSFDKDELKYMTAPYQSSLKIYSWDSGSPVEIPAYTLEKADGNDPYDIFLSGAKVSMITIENENAASDRELIIFRDSFGSSISPYFAEGYAKITILDPRVLPTMTLNYFVQNGTVSFEGADVLFMFSSTLLNNSNELK